VKTRGLGGEIGLALTGAIGRAPGPSSQDSTGEAQAANISEAATSPAPGEQTALSVEPSDGDTRNPKIVRNRSHARSMPSDMNALPPLSVDRVDPNGRPGGARP